ncbi:protein takeout-like [Anthonomus grandis grandis]|uniref:protein takeout-like n=1 Tax=Anthonomus grandis grandis TaxID=2921223 RepID=UPI00216500B6|nr:protein takeout-like [Anthonomus grandis grandis]
MFRRLFWLFLLLNYVYGKSKLPSFINICHKSDPNIKQCLINSIESLRPFLANGIEELGIPSCEPLVISEVLIDQGNGPVSVKSTYKNIKVFGPSEFLLRNVKINLDKDRFKIKLFIPKLNISTDYTMDGKILMMPISGSGASTGNYSNVEAIMTMKAKKIQKDEETYYNIEDCYVDFNIGHAELHFDNLFNGNEELGASMNLFLNDNWKSVVNEIKPVLEDRIAGIFKKFANKIFHKYPISMLFPE